MKLRTIFLAITFVSIATAAYSQPKPDSIFIGAKAPPLVLNNWLKGQPIGKLEKGKIYIIQFTIVNCPHCGPAIPILSRLAEKYKKDVTVLSVYMDDPKYVKLYVETMGDRMGYSVAVDESETNENYKKRIMYKTWLVNEGKRGYPTIFIINREGEIAWIGHPCAWYVDELVNQIVEIGSYDKIKFKEWDESHTQFSLFTMSALKDKDKYGRAIQLLDSFLIRNPTNGDRISLKLKLLIQYDEQKAYQYARSILDGFCKEKNCDSWNILTKMAAIFIENASTLKHADWDLVASLAAHQSMISDSIYWPFSFQAQAEAMYQKGNFKSAVDLQIQAIEYLKFLFLIRKPSLALAQYYDKKLVLYKEKAGL